MKHNDPSTMSCAEKLNTIHRLRLFRNTTGELSAHTGIQLRNNSFSKKSAFITRCIYSEFNREVQERIGEDLDGILINYYMASLYFGRIAHTYKARPEFHRAALRCLLDDTFANSESAKPYLAEAQNIAKLDVAILTLLILGMIPPFQAKTGDVDPNTHLEHLSLLRDYFQPLYDSSPLFQFAPFLTERYQKAVKKIRQCGLFTRLELIYFAQDIIANLEHNYNPESLLQANRSIDQLKIHPDLIHDCWVEYDSCGGTPVYWQFEEIGADYILIRQEFDQAKEQITEIRYEVCFYQDTTKIAFQIIRQSEIADLCKGKPIPQKAYMKGLCNLDDIQKPKRIEWIFTTNCYDNFPKILIRSENNLYDKLIATAKKDHWDTICTTGHYEYLPAERVISTHHIYVECTSCEQEGERMIDTWYKIPRTALLEEVDMNTPIAHIRHDEHIYICFIPMNQSFDVTNEKTRAKGGIEIVNQIVITEPVLKD